MKRTSTNIILPPKGYKLKVCKRNEKARNSRKTFKHYKGSQAFKEDDDVHQLLRLVTFTNSHICRKLKGDAYEYFRKKSTYIWIYNISIDLSILHLPCYVQLYLHTYERTNMYIKPMYTYGLKNYKRKRKKRYHRNHIFFWKVEKFWCYEISCTFFFSGTQS